MIRRHSRTRQGLHKDTHRPSLIAHTSRFVLLYRAMAMVTHLRATVKVGILHLAVLSAVPDWTPAVEALVLNYAINYETILQFARLPPDIILAHKNKTNVNVTSLTLHRSRFVMRQDLFRSYF